MSILTAPTEGFAITRWQSVWRFPSSYLASLGFIVSTSSTLWIFESDISVCYGLLSLKLKLATAMPRLCGVYLMRKTFVSIDPSLEAHTWDCGLQTNISSVSYKASFFSIVIYIIAMHLSKRTLHSYYFTPYHSIFHCFFTYYPFSKVH